MAQYPATLAALSDSEVVGARSGMVFRFNGSITTLAGGPSGSLRGIWGGPQSVLVGAGSDLYRYANSAWTKVPQNSSGCYVWYESTSGTGESDVWLATGNGWVTSSPCVRHWDGNGLQNYALTFKPNGVAATPNAVWVAGPDGNVARLRR